MTTTTKKTLTSDSQNKGLTLDNAYDTGVSFTGSNDTTQYNEHFNAIWDTNIDDGARMTSLESKGDSGKKYDGTDDTCGLPCTRSESDTACQTAKGGQNTGEVIRCCEGGYMYKTHNQDGYYYPRCKPNTFFYDYKYGENGVNNVEGEESGIVKCCKGDPSVKTDGGQIDIEKCAFITDDNYNWATGRACNNNTKASTADCKYPTTSKIWAPWSKDCALNTTVIDDYCSTKMVQELNTKSTDYEKIYAWYLPTENEGNNCNLWKQYATQDIQDSNNPEFANVNIIKTKYNDVVNNFCKIDEDDPLKLGLSFPCSCLNYDKNPIYVKLYNQMKQYCCNNPNDINTCYNDPNCMDALNSPQCWLQNCSKTGDLPVFQNASQFDKCPDVQCNVFLNISDNDIGGDFDIGDVTVDACNQYANADEKQKVTVLVISIVGTLVFLTMILFIFKFLNKK